MPEHSGSSEDKAAQEIADLQSIFAGEKEQVPHPHHHRPPPILGPKPTLRKVDRTHTSTNPVDPSTTSRGPPIPAAKPCRLQSASIPRKPLPSVPQSSSRSRASSTSSTGSARSFSQRGSGSDDQEEVQRAGKKARQKEKGQHRRAPDSKAKGRIGVVKTSVVAGLGLGMSVGPANNVTDVHMHHSPPDIHDHEPSILVNETPRANRINDPLGLHTPARATTSQTPTINKPRPSPAPVNPKIVLPDNSLDPEDFYKSLCKTRMTPGNITSLREKVNKLCNGFASTHPALGKLIFPYPVPLTKPFSHLGLSLLLQDLRWKETDPEYDVGMARTAISGYILHRNIPIYSLGRHSALVVSTWEAMVRGDVTHATLGVSLLTLVMSQQEAEGVQYGQTDDGQTIPSRQRWWLRWAVELLKLTESLGNIGEGCQFIDIRLCCPSMDADGEMLVPNDVHLLDVNPLIDLDTDTYSRLSPLYPIIQGLHALDSGIISAGFPVDRWIQGLLKVAREQTDSCAASLILQGVFLVLARLVEIRIVDCDEDQAIRYARTALDEVFGAELLAGRGKNWTAPWVYAGWVRISNDLQAIERQNNVSKGTIGRAAAATRSSRRLAEEMDEFWPGFCE